MEVSIHNSRKSLGYLMCAYMGQGAGLEVPSRQNEPSGQGRQSFFCLLPMWMLYVPAGQGNWEPYAVPEDAASTEVYAS